MSLQPFQTLMRPVLVALEDGQDHTSGEIRSALVREFSLTDHDLAERNPRSPHTRFVNHVAWALHHLSRAKLVERRRPQVYRITQRGRTVLATHPTSVDIKVCQRFDEWHHSRARRARG
jgi:restriction system protein